MNDFANYLIGAAVGIAVLVLLVSFGAALKADVISDHCRDFGQFRIGDTIYDCAVQEVIEPAWKE